MSHSAGSIFKYMYLDIEELNARLNVGKIADQWLGAVEHSAYTVIKWVSIQRWSGEFNVCYFEVFDDGDINNLNLYDFELLEPDNIGGEINSFSDFQTALNFSYDRYGCKPDKFVNNGYLTEEYKKYVIERDSGS